MVIWTFFQTSEDIDRYKKMLFAQCPLPHKFFLTRFVLWRATMMLLLLRNEHNREHNLPLEKIC